MLRSLSRLPLLRCGRAPARHVSTEARRNGLATASTALGLATAATGVVAYSAYYIYRVRQPAEKIALDAPPEHPLSAQSATSRHAVSTAASDHTDSEPSFSSAPSPEASSAPPEDADAPEPGEGASSGGSGGAYNPETGEINWDCPCLGGMAHGPCGEQFKAAFSCFVRSEDEPKGINCVDKFRMMQDCFREHPEVYGEELMNDDDDDEAALDADAPKPEFADAPSPSETLGGPVPEQMSPDAATLTEPSPSRA